MEGFPLRRWAFLSERLMVAWQLGGGELSGDCFGSGPGEGGSLWLVMACPRTLLLQGARPALNGCNRRLWEWEWPSALPKTTKETRVKGWWPDLQPVAWARCPGQVGRKSSETWKRRLSGMQAKSGLLVASLLRKLRQEGSRLEGKTLIATLYLFHVTLWCQDFLHLPLCSMS